MTDQPDDLSDPAGLALSALALVRATHHRNNAEVDAVLVNVDPEILVTALVAVLEAVFEGEARRTGQSFDGVVDSAVRGIVRGFGEGAP